MTSILFIHGLESGPHGSKMRFLRHQFGDAAVHCVDMEMSAYNPLRRNSPARWVLAYAVTTALLLFAVATVQTAAFVTALAAVAVSAGLPLTRWLLARSLHTCAQLQRRAIQQQKPDIVVGSSWGGIVALQCAHANYWQGPMLLLAPAVKVHGFWGLLWPAPPGPKGLRAWAARAGMAQRCLVVQGMADTTVDAAAVRTYCLAAGLDIKMVQKGDHRLNAALIDSGWLQELVKGLLINSCDKRQAESQHARTM